MQTHLSAGLRITTIACAIAAAVPALGCNHQTPTRPGPIVEAPPANFPPVPPPTSRTIAIVSGWDQTPVPSAQVRLADAMMSVDANGRFVSPETTPSDATVDVDASGFLPFRTRLRGVAPTNLIELWPAANDAEAEAIRAMVFHQGNGKLIRYEWWDAYYLTLLVDGLPGTGDEIASDWKREYGEIQNLTGLPLNLSPTPRDADGFEEEVIVTFDGSEDSCQDAWGFCAFWNTSFPYFSRPYRVVRTRAHRPDVIRRVLAHGLLNANPLPGLLNKAAPATELSLLEKQTLRMLFRRPAGTRWPDTSPIR